jgi:serine/threonine-protein kinase RsbW
MSSEAGAGNRQTRELLDLTIPATVGELSSATEAVMKILASLGIPEDKQIQIDLAVQEALANSVVHGCGNDPSKSVRCQLSSDDDGRVLIVVSDPGPGFDVGAVPDPRSDENLHSDHGRGIYLIRQLMDEVEFQRGGSELRMWKY